MESNVVVEPVAIDEATNAIPEPSDEKDLPVACEQISSMTKEEDEIVEKPTNEEVTEDTTEENKDKIMEKATKEEREEPLENATKDEKLTEESSEKKESATGDTSYRYDEATGSWQLESEHYKWCGETQKWIPKQTDAIAETEHHRWDAEKKEWVAKTEPSQDTAYAIDEDGQTIYRDNDGVVFFWDVDRKAWFPKVDDDMLARYQMSYGFTETTDETTTTTTTTTSTTTTTITTTNATKSPSDVKVPAEEDAGFNATGVKRKATPAWFQVDPEHNTKVYVENLPLDITVDEFAELMGKCGMISRDADTQKFKIKLYAEADGQLKGDGLCDYIKVESVDLALSILDEYVYRGHKLSVQRAKFQMRGDYNPSLKPKRKKKDKDKMKKMKEKLFDWRPERMRGERAKHERVVILKNYFHPKVFEDDLKLILEYQNNLRDECSKCGTVYKVVLYDQHEEGVAQINMSAPEEADLVIQMMQGRYFGKRQLTAEHWDGKTKYKSNESEKDEEKRLSSWDMYLENEEGKEKTQNANDTTDIPSGTKTLKDVFNDGSTIEDLETRSESL